MASLVQDALSSGRVHSPLDQLTLILEGGAGQGSLPKLMGGIGIGAGKRGLVAASYNMIECPGGLAEAALRGETGRGQNVTSGGVGESIRLKGT